MKKKLQGSSIFEVVTAVTLVLIIFTIAIHAITSIMYMKNMQLTINAQNLLKACTALEQIDNQGEHPIYIIEKEQSQAFINNKTPFFLERVTVKLNNGQTVNQQINIVGLKNGIGN